MKSLKVVARLGTRLLSATMFLIPLLAGFTSQVAAKSDNSPGVVYTIDNVANGNHVLMYGRASDGTLSWQEAFDSDD